MKQLIIKDNFFLFALCLAALSIGVIHSCKKDVSVPVPTGTIPDSIITTSFTEEFENVPDLPGKGWVMEDSTFEDSSIVADWGQGFSGESKGDTTWFGFNAYSYKTSPDEFAYSLVSRNLGIPYRYSASSWLITPILSVKNGDKISFYTRGDTTGIFTDRMQVLMDESTSTVIGDTLSSVGDFTTLLIDINPTQAPGGYPTTWTKYEYTFSGISGTRETRIGFRHYVVDPVNARGVGIDVFKFEAN
jgi:hypothetical protein